MGGHSQLEGGVSAGLNLGSPQKALNPDPLLHSPYKRRSQCINLRCPRTPQTRAFIMNLVTGTQIDIPCRPEEGKIPYQSYSRRGGDPKGDPSDTQDTPRREQERKRNL